jgi:hypothetical protein
MRSGQLWPRPIFEGLYSPGQREAPPWLAPCSLVPGVPFCWRVFVGIGRLGHACTALVKSRESADLYALRAWLSGEHAVSARTRRFAKWSAIFSFALGMAGQVAYHLLAQAGAARTPWPITTIVPCLPALVLGMGTALAHMLRADTACAA